MVHTRRGFIRVLPALGTAPAAWSVFASSLQAAAASATPSQEKYWDLVREQFPLEEGLTYLNAANICPASRLVLDRYQRFLLDFHSNPSFQNREKYKPAYEQLRGKLASMLAATPDEIAITRNTSEGSAMVVKGIDLKRGDEIVITDHNHPSNNDAWKMRARREGLEIKSVPVTVPARSRQDLIAAFDKVITPRTKVVAFTHVTSTTGILYPARDITELAHKRNAWVHLDGAQSFGLLKVNLREIGCDSYSGSAHKWMMGPLESGVLYVRADRIGQVWPAIVTAGWADDLKGARKLEVLGQRDDPRIVAFEAAVDFYNTLGPDRVEARTRELVTRLKKDLGSVRNLRMKTNIEPELSAAVVKFQLTNRDTKESYDKLWSRNRMALAITPTGDAEGIRISPHVYNSMADVERGVAAVREVARG
jgi:selenocysteine lyase/cysteine desulfurase